MNIAENTKVGMKSRMYKPEDYTTLEKWWKDHNWTPVLKDMLPTIGLVISSDDVDVCAGFLYTTNSNVMLLEWVISDPNADKEVRAKCLDNLVEQLILMAEIKKCKYLFTWIQHPNLMNLLETKGFIKADTQMTNMVRITGV